MALFGKTVKLFTLPGFSAQSAPSDAQKRDAISNRQYIKDVSLCCPMIDSIPTMGSTRTYADKYGVLNSDTATFLDSITLQWQLIGGVVYSTLPTDNTVYSNIYAQFPMKHDFNAANGMLLWDEETDYALLAYPYNLTVQLVNVSTGAGAGVSALTDAFVNRAFPIRTDDTRIFPDIVFYINGTIYRYSNDNSSGGQSPFTLSRTATTLAVNAAAAHDFWDGASEDYTPPTPPPEDTDPFAPGGTSEPGGGNGTFNGTSDSNPIPGDPTISATDTGFMTVFATNVAGIKSLANSLWTDIFSAIQPGGSLEGTVEALKNIVGSPYDAILGCHIVPVNVPVGASRTVKMYGVLPSEVSLPVASSQWVHKDCGSLTIQPYDGSYLDYAPYSKVTSLYLPFVGVVSVDIDIIMNTTIGVYYKIDIVSGQCIVYVTKDNNVYFQYQGQCAVPIPVTSIDWSNTVSAGLGLIGSVTNIVGSAVGGALAGGPAGALSGAVTGTIGQAGSMAQNVMNSKPDIKAGSGVGGAAALLGCKSPYLIIERPRKSTPKNQNHYTGYPSNIRAKLGTLEGYTEVSRVYVNHMNATTEEKAEIERLLNDGVVFPKRSSN